MIRIVAFDADDTLWLNESRFVESKANFCHLLTPYRPQSEIDAVLHETEMRNLKHFGYGVKGFTLSMIETAIEISQNKITATDISKILTLGKEMLAAPVELLPGVAETIKTLAETYTLMVITKGDLFDQESKVARSRLGDFFTHVEIVSEKDVPTYSRIMKRHNVSPAEFVMIGNSVKSDVLPVVRAGGLAIHIPHEFTWAHEVAKPDSHEYYITLENILQVREALLKMDSPA